jgi:hypothetical protein
MKQERNICERQDEWQYVKTHRINRENECENEHENEEKERRKRWKREEKREREGTGIVLSSFNHADL